MKKLFVLFLSWFIFINIFAILANNRVNLNPDTAYSWINPAYTFQRQGFDVVDVHNRWDSYWYLDIAKNGYVDKGVNQLSNIVFFPLYPLLLNMVTFIIGNNYVLSGFLVSTFFTLLSVVYLYKIAQDFHKQSDPLLAVFMLLIFPTAFFLNSVYSESLFLFLSISSYYYASKNNFLGAGILGFFAALTRITGVLLFLPLLIELIKSKRSNLFSLKVFPLFLIPLGTFLFFLYHYLRFGDFLLFLKVEKYWGRGFSFNLEQLGLLTNSSISNFSLDFFLLVFSLVAVVFVIKKLRLSYGIYMISTILVALSSGTTMSIGRYILILFPIYILGSTLKNEIFRYVWMLISTLLFGLYTLLFVSHYWAG